MTPNISQNELFQKIKKGNPPLIVDVRSTLEYRSGHIQGALHIPFFSIFKHKGRFPDDKHRPIVLTCEHGPRAGIAKLFLWVSGYRNVRYLEGHMAAWKDNNLPTVS